MKTRILVIEDDPGVLQVLRTLLTRRGYEVVAATDGRDGIKYFDTHSAHLVITDILMPNVDGIETLRRIKETQPTVPVLVISGGHDIGPEYYLRIAKALGATEGLMKPFGADDLYATVERLLATANTSRTAAAAPALPTEPENQARLP